MPLASQGYASGRYIIRTQDDAEQLAQFIHDVNADPDMELLDTIGPPGQPHTVVVAMPPEAARTLEQRFSVSKQLSIEPDRPLSLFAKGEDEELDTEGKHMPKIPESGNLPENAPQTGNGASSSSSSSSPGKLSRTAGAPAGEAASASPQSESTGRTISQRKGQFLIAPRKTPGMQLMGIQPLSFGYIEQTLRNTPDIEVVDTVGPKSIMGALADSFNEVPSVLVVKMTEQKAAMLHQQGQGRLIVERDQYLALLDPAFLPPMLVAGAAPTAGPELNTTIVVQGKDNTPIKGAEVYVFGTVSPASGTTDDAGRVTLSLYGETTQSIRALYVKPKSDYWSFYQPNPDLSADEPNVVGLRSLSEWQGLADFPQQQAYTWGQKAMRLDQLPSDYRGQGVKIAVIDSGAATTHDDLRKIRFGFDVINKKTNPNTWNEDVISHGSHCAGVIAGADNNVGVRGFAPDAEIHVCKLFPGGQISQLIDALEYCIEKQIDVVNMSLGSAEPSEALEQQILRAKRAGIACIVAAGNSAGPVQYPASSPNALAVTAIGKLNEFPPDSYHAQTLTPFVDANGFFAAKFSCFGPEVAVCAPGVAIASSVPSNNYAVWDGTSMAAPHVTGLAALVLAHHPDFQAAYKGRGPERVERLFQIIRMSSRRINLGDPGRTGFGLPDVLTAVGLQPQAGMQAVAGGFAATPQGTALGGLLSNIGAQVAQSSLAAQGIWPFAAAYRNPMQLIPQTWFGQWGQQVDPYAAAYLQRLGFGMQPGFGRGGW